MALVPSDVGQTNAPKKYKQDISSLSAGQGLGLKAGGKAAPLGKGAVVVAESAPCLRSGKQLSNTAVAISRTYFEQSGSAPSLRGDQCQPSLKRKRIDLSGPLSFAPDLLEKAPSSLQSCRSLLVYLNKKLEVPVGAPLMEGPKDLQDQLGLYSKIVVRVPALRGLADGEPSAGWDSRGRRVLDLHAFTTPIRRATSLGNADRRLVALSAELREGLLERGEQSLGTLTRETQAWAVINLRQEWLAWCQRILQAREKALIAEERGTVAKVLASRRISADDIFQALLEVDGICPADVHNGD